MVAATSTLSAGTVLAAAIVVCLSNMTLPITGLIPLEMIEGACTSLRHWAVVAIAGIVTVVDVAVVAGATVVPGASSDEQTTVEPIRSVVTVRRAVVWGIVVIAIGTRRRYPNTDRNLGWYSGWCSDSSGKQNSAHCGEYKILHTYRVTPMPSKR